MRKYFTAAADYMGLRDPLCEPLQHAANMNRRQIDATLCSLRYFMGRFARLLPQEVTVDDVEEELQLFQSTRRDDGTIPKSADEAWREMDLMATGGGKLFCKSF